MIANVLEYKNRLNLLQKHFLSTKNAKNPENPKIPQLSSDFYF